MSDTTCPHCGAEKICFVYSCLTFADDLLDRGKACYERQIEAQAAENERLIASNATMAGMVLKAIQDEREACAQLCERHVCASECSAYGLGSNCEAVIAQEIRARGEVK